MRVVALIIGIDNWEKYTLPLIESIWQKEPACELVVIDNASAEPYLAMPCVRRTERLSYSKAINHAAKLAGDADWYVVLSNDVLCTGQFIHLLADTKSNAITGPCLKENQGWQYLEGWCVATPANVWKTLGGWDENFIGSSWEDVDHSISAMEHGFSVVHRLSFPFVHLDQRQRFNVIPDYWSTEGQNVRYFAQKHGVPG